MRSSSSMAVPKATAPTTLGEPASSRSGGSVQMTSSRSTRSTAPPPARNGSPDSNVCAWPDERARAEGRVELVAAEGDEVGARTGAGGAAPAGPRRPGPARRARGRRRRSPPPAAAIPSRWTPRSARAARARGPSSSTRTTSSTPNVPSVPHSTQRRVATRAQGSRLAWCSTTVVATTSSGPRPSR